MSISLGELARRIDARLVGDPDIEVDCVETLDSAGPGSVSFLFNRRYRKFLEITRASAVIVFPVDEPLCPVAALVSNDPYLGYAKAAALFNPDAEFEAGIHPAATVAESAKVNSSARIAAQAVVEANVQIEEHVLIGPGCCVGRGARISAYTQLVANVSVGHGVVLGRRNLVHPGAVIGADGFGLAKDGERWLKIPQLGSVQVGDDVEIGANTTIDRGSLKDTVIGSGVKLDNQIQIGHNVRIGEHTAIAGNTAVAGSVTIGKRCTIAGCVGITGHLEIADDTTVLAMSLVTKSIREPGTYSSSWPAVEHRVWKRRVSILGRVAKGRSK
jgi:UDP-3-O-[3-hydroxymyristoyl] glucosamine N-acyltransferase